MKKFNAIIFMSLLFAVNSGSLATNNIIEVSETRLSSSQTASLILEAEKFASVIARGSDSDLALVLAPMYEQGASDPYVRSLIFGPSEYRDKKGFREILRGMSDIKAVVGSAFKVDGKNLKLRARAYLFDPSKISPKGILRDNECRALRASYISQLFEWDGNTWRPCCLLFESETDGPCG